MSTSVAKKCFEGVTLWVLFLLYSWCHLGQHESFDPVCVQHALLTRHLVVGESVTGNSSEPILLIHLKGTVICHIELFGMRPEDNVHVQGDRAPRRPTFR